VGDNNDKKSKQELVKKNNEKEPVASTQDSKNRKQF
jgi:hypothetical protein